VERVRVSLESHLAEPPTGTWPRTSATLLAAVNPIVGSLSDSLVALGEGGGGGALSPRVAAPRSPHPPPRNPDLSDPRVEVTSCDIKMTSPAPPLTNGPH
jgi:hypothetical protein